MYEFYLRDTCRLCGSKKLTLVLPLKDSALCDAYLKERKEQKFYSLKLYKCDECDFVQIDSVVNPEIIYRDYIYVTTSSLGLSKHFENYSNDVCRALNLTNSKLTIDIGSNEGVLLEDFIKHGHKVIGIEPSYKAAEIANSKGIETLPEFFDDDLAKRIVEKYGYADLVTINNLYANIDDLDNFTKGVEKLLSKDGVLVIESSYLQDMVDNIVFDFIYHEHLSYFSILPLVKFFKKFNMKLINLQKVSTKGGSMRYFFAKEDSKWSTESIVDELSQKEKSIVSFEYFKDFENKINLEKSKLIKFLEESRDKTIIGYGASATTTTLISHFGIARYFSYLIDDNPGKIGTYSPGFQIPVCSPENMKEEENAILIILAWRYKDAIIPKVAKNIKTIAIPLPSFGIINR